MIGPTDLDELPETILKMLERPKPAPAPATSISVATVSPADRLKRARAYLAAIPPAVAGSGGHQQTWSAALALAVGFDLSDDEAYNLLATEYNPRCNPPWTERELWHKVRSASKQSRRPRGWLLEKKTAPLAAAGRPDETWREQLRYSGGSNPKLLKTAHNVEIILRFDERWRGVIARDMFADVVLVRGTPPMDRFADAPPQWRDIDDTLLQFWIEREFDVTISLDAIMRAVQAAAAAVAYHPVRDYLESLTWDGNKRLDTWLMHAFDVDPTPFAQTVGSKWAISAVARIYEPGCKVDHVLVLEGDPGMLKSSAALALCGEPAWFLDELAEMGTKDAAEQIDGRWIVELGELDTINRSEVSAIKAFLSRQVDRYRPAFGRHVVYQPRQCVFIGTVNPGANGYLRDETGNRRFWPVACRRAANIDWVRAHRDQLWAEAVARYKGREKWYLDDAEMRRAAEAEQLARVARDAWQDKIERWLIGKDETNVGEILEKVFSLPIAKWDTPLQMRVGRSLVIAGWHRRRRWRDGRYAWVYVSEKQLGLPLGGRSGTEAGS